ncbi:hypothetical protein DAEQUDRAFT_37861 [Daedalea quercina L-15889]|uniref:Uncharacterized protein n=1 Tax=Daedalea quercina L-15889 TaxID=1314783 RepID=A0A165LFQ9_9APHY|nr:hypothetical protein DAEQUDRAFT_37861 [Daedalea quercina L-15889]
MPNTHVASAQGGTRQLELESDFVRICNCNNQVRTGGCISIAQEILATPLVAYGTNSTTRTAIREPYTQGMPSALIKANITDNSHVRPRNSPEPAAAARQAQRRLELCRPTYLERLSLRVRNVYRRLPIPSAEPHSHATQDHEARASRKF